MSNEWGDWHERRVLYGAPERVDAHHRAHFRFDGRRAGFVVVA